MVSKVAVLGRIRGVDYGHAEYCMCFNKQPMLIAVIVRIAPYTEVLPTFYILAPLRSHPEILFKQC